MKKKQAKGGSLECQRINFQLNELEMQVYHLFNDYLKINPQPDPKDFKKYIDYQLFSKGSGVENQIYVNGIFKLYTDLQGI